MIDRIISHLKNVTLKHFKFFENFHCAHYFIAPDFTSNF